MPEELVVGPIQLQAFLNEAASADRRLVLKDGATKASLVEYWPATGRFVWAASEADLEKSLAHVGGGEGLEVNDLYNAQIGAGLVDGVVADARRLLAHAAADSRVRNPEPVFLGMDTNVFYLGLAKHLIEDAGVEHEMRILLSDGVRAELGHQVGKKFKNGVPAGAPPHWRNWPSKQGRKAQFALGEMARLHSTEDALPVPSGETGYDSERNDSVILQSYAEAFTHHRGVCYFLSADFDARFKSSSQRITPIAISTANGRAPYRGEASWEQFCDFVAVLLPAAGTLLLGPLELNFQWSGKLVEHQRRRLCKAFVRDGAQAWVRRARGLDAVGFNST